MQVERKLPGLTLAPPPASPKQSGTPPTEEERKRQASRKANWISAGIFFAATGVGAGISYVLNSFAPRTVGKAVEPVLNTGVGVGQSAGGRFQEQYLNPIRSFVFRTATGPSRGSDAAPGAQQSKVIYPAANASMIDMSNQRNKLNGRVSAMSDNFAMYSSMLELSCEAAKRRLEAGDTHGAVRHLAGALVHDHNIWLENSPKSERTYERLYLQLHPYFARLPSADIEAFCKAVGEEAVRLSKREGLPAYVDAIVKGLTSRARKQLNHPLLLQAPGERATVSLEGRPDLKHAANDEDGDTELKKALDEHFAKLLEGKGWFARFKIRRTQRRVTKNVLRIVHAKVEESGKWPSMDELWVIVQGQLNADASRAVENRITAISFGAFAGAGAASGVGKFYLEKAISPQIMVGVEAVVFTLVGIAMGTAGSFFQDRFNNIARAFGYGGLEKVTMGPQVERELLDNLLRTWTVDGRVMGGRNAYLWYSRFAHEAVLDAEAAIKAGDLETAADFLSGCSQYGRKMFFSFSPLMEAFEVFFNKVGPHFDLLTAVQRDELIRMVEERVKTAGATSKEMQIYHAPFIRGLLLTNVEAKSP